MDYNTAIQSTDKVPEGFEKFELSNGKTYCGRANGCFFCSHLTDIFLDWNGPYALICDCHDDTSKGLSGECPFFKKHRPVVIHDETKGGKLNVCGKIYGKEIFFGDRGT